MLSPIANSKTAIRPSSPKDLNPWDKVNSNPRLCSVVGGGKSIETICLAHERIDPFPYITQCVSEQCYRRFPSSSLLLNPLTWVFGPLSSPFAYCWPLFLSRQEGRPEAECRQQPPPRTSSASSQQCPQPRTLQHRWNRHIHSAVQCAYMMHGTEYSQVPFPNYN